jgi:outer membrane protein assembly factor BamD
MRRVAPWRLLALFLCALSLAGCGASVLPAIHSEQERLEAARHLLDKGNYAAATELLKTYVMNNAGSADVDQAIYLLGYAQLKNRAWIEAAGEFERLLRDYPESDSSAAARFGLAESQFAQSRPPEYDQEYTHRALDEYQRYLQDFPGHWRNEEARARVLACRTRLADKLMRTGELYLKLHRPGPARVYFEKVVSEYPETPWKPDAEVGVAVCEGQEGSPKLAITMLQDIESRYPGTATAKRALRERKRLEHH